MKTTKTLICLATLAFLLSLTAQAQFTEPSPDAQAVPTWSTFIGQQLARSLQSPIAEIRQGALQQITHLATFRRDDVDLSVTIPVLLSIYRHDPDERCRVAAVAGLHALGDENTLIQMRQSLRHQPSSRVQMATLGTLMSFYGPATFADDPEMARMAEAIREQANTVIDTSAATPVVASGK